MPVPMSTITTVSPRSSRRPRRRGDDRSRSTSPTSTNTDTDHGTIASASVSASPTGTGLSSPSTSPSPSLSSSSLPAPAQATAPATTTTFIMPDLVSHCPYQLRIHPHYKKANAGSVSWLLGSLSNYSILPSFVAHPQSVLLSQSIGIP